MEGPAIAHPVYSGAPAAAPDIPVYAPPPRSAVNAPAYTANPSAHAPVSAYAPPPPPGSMAAPAYNMYAPPPQIQGFGGGVPVFNPAAGGGGGTTVYNTMAAASDGWTITLSWPIFAACILIMTVVGYTVLLMVGDRKARDNRAVRTNLKNFTAHAISSASHTARTIKEEDGEQREIRRRMVEEENGRHDRKDRKDRKDR